jgi:hypothetical protein
MDYKQYIQLSIIPLTGLHTEFKGRRIRSLSLNPFSTWLVLTEYSNIARQDGCD